MVPSPKTPTKTLNKLHMKKERIQKLKPHPPKVQISQINHFFRAFGS